MSCTNYMVIKILPSPGVGGGGDSHMKQTGKLIISFRGVNIGF